MRSPRVPSLLRPLVLALGLLVIAPGCGDKATTTQADAVAAKPAAPARLDGKVRLADVWIEVPPLILHDAKMDLKTRCRVAQDEAKEASRPVPPLCFSTETRDRSKIETIRVERWPGLPSAIRSITATAEGTHFLVERTGSIHQTLDLAFPVRRDNELRPTEIRVIAADPTHGKALVDALAALFPAARVETVDGVPVAAPPGTPGAPPEPPKPVIAPSKPAAGDPHDHDHDHGDPHNHDHQ